jgi:protein transport protein SEC31
LLATGTVAGALDESFSNESLLEIWEPDFLERNEFDLGFQDGSQSAAVDGQKGKGGAKGHVTDASRYVTLC